MTDTLSTEDYELCGKLKAMLFSGMVEALEVLLWALNPDLIPFREKVGLMVDAEWDLHYSKKLNRYEAMDICREALSNLVSFYLLVIDDFGLMQMDLNKCQNLFEVLESQDLGHSTKVISQFPVNA